MTSRKRRPIPLPLRTKALDGSHFQNFPKNGRRWEEPLHGFHKGFNKTCEFLCRCADPCDRKLSAPSAAQSYPFGWSISNLFFVNMRVRLASSWDTLSRHRCAHSMPLEIPSNLRETWLYQGEYIEFNLWFVLSVIQQRLDSGHWDPNFYHERKRWGLCGQFCCNGIETVGRKTIFGCRAAATSEAVGVILSIHVRI